MPYLKHTPLILPIRLGPNLILLPRGISGLNTTQKSKARISIMMPQSDGTNESKPTSPSLLSRTNTQRMRKRLVSIFTPSKGTETDLDDSNSNNNSMEAIDESNPMRLVSPRATTYEPSITSSIKQRTFSFKRRKSKLSTKTTPTLTPTSMTTSTSAQVDDAGSGVHIPVSEAPYPCQPRKDSVGMAMLTRETALTSHPVFKVEEGESEREYATPVSEVASEIRGRKEA
jgi:hypothetical protein